MKNKLITTLAIIALALTTYAQPGTLDTTFNPGTGANNRVFTTSIQNNGKIIIGGDFNTYNGIARNNIARLNNDGTLDFTFNPGTGTFSSISISKIYTTSIQNNGKIIIGGDFTSYNGIARNCLARLSVDGSIDGTFNPGTGANSYVETSSIQSNGKLIIGGDFITYNGIARNKIARLNAIGTLDLTFNLGTGANGNIKAIAIQGDGKIIIGGEFTSYNGTGRNYIARLNSEGTLDTTFILGAGTNGFVRTISIQSNGKIIIGGSFTSYNGMGRNFIARLNDNGTLDTTFNPGSGANNFVRNTAIQIDGQLIIGGNFTSYNGIFRDYIVRLNTDGSLDQSFNNGIGANNYIYSTSIQSDGKIIIGGEFTKYNGTTRNQIARIYGGFAIASSDLKSDLIQIYPNPNNGSFNISGDFSNANNIDISIFDYTGRMVFLNSLKSSSEPINTNLAQGIYLVRLKSNQNIYTSKLIIE